MSRFANIDGPVTFLLYNLEYYFFSKVDLELFLDSKTVLENVTQYVLKTLKGRFLGKLCSYIS